VNCFINFTNKSVAASQKCLKQFHALSGSGVPRNFFFFFFGGGGGFQQIQLRTEDREDGDLGALAP